MQRLRAHPAFLRLACGLAIALTACGTSTSPSPTVQPSQASAFVSPLYAYTADLPDAWRPEPATESWDGDNGNFGDSTANSDRFHAGSGETIWAVAAPTTKTLDAMVADQAASDVETHDCDPVPDTDEEITVGGEPARLTVKNCAVGSETVIGTAAVIHGESGYYFFFIHPENILPDPDAIDHFTDFLARVTFP